LQSGGEPCCDWIGVDVAGHFVHNGIKYGDRQFISERYELMRVAE
jgi:6-phosphogluconate dehydrogenase